MNFIIFGAGTVGSYIGGRLALAGQTVTFVGRPRIIDVLAVHGLYVTDLEGFKGHVEAAALRLAPSLQEAIAKNAASAEDETVILMCVKGGSTESAGSEIAQACQPGTTVVSLQNGVDNVARIQACAPQMRVLAGMVPYNVVSVVNVVVNVMADAGQSSHRVHRATMGSLHIGHASGEASRSSGPGGPTEFDHQIATRLNASGLPTVLSNNMRAVQWGKLLLNLNNPVNALSDLPLQAQLQDRDYRRVLADLQTEALAVMARAGITPVKVAAVAPRVMPHLLRLPNWLFTRLAARMLRMDAQARSSMWDDLQQGRTTEIDDLCGAVVRLAQAHGVAAPQNARMCVLVKNHTAGQRLSGEQMRQALSVN